MNKIITYLAITMSATALIIAGIPIQPTAHASSCRGTPIGLICVPPPGPYKLREGIWNAHVNGINAILNISSVSSMGNIRGTLYTGNTTMSNSSMIAICTAAHPCVIAGSFDTKSGKVSFTSHNTIGIVPESQNYTGYLSQRAFIDVVKYTIDGIGMTIRPIAGHGFGWDASMICIVNGPCLGGTG